MESPKGSYYSLKSSRDSRYESSSSQSLASIITVSSETQQVPKVWKHTIAVSKNKENLIDLQRSPNNSEKVENWIKSCDYNALINSESKEKEVENVCLRYDFKKTPTTPRTPIKSYFTKTKPLLQYIEEARKNAKLKGFKELRVLSEKDDPLSPESQKKELCNYLQLMKPDEKRHSFFIEYRRSTRAKTLVELKQREVTDFKTENRFLPLPPKRIYEEFVDFEQYISNLVQDYKKHAHNGVKKEVKKKKLRFDFKFRHKLNDYNTKRLRTLRSRGRLKEICLEKLLKQKERKKARNLFRQKSVVKAKKPESPRCEIVSVHSNSDDENVDLQNFVDDMLELDKMSEEHRKSVIESRILASGSLTNLIKKRTSQDADLQKAYKIFTDFSKPESQEYDGSKTEETSPRPILEVELKEVSPKNETPKVSVSKAEEKSPGPVFEVKLKENETPKVSVSKAEEKSAEPISEVEPKEVLKSETNVGLVDHDYANFSSSPEEDTTTELDDQSAVSLSPVPRPNLQVQPISSEIKINSLHRSLTLSQRRKLFMNNYGLQSWGSGSNSNRKLNHSIAIEKKNGLVIRGFYQDFNLVLIQLNLVGFWTQSALGNVLGAQNMWIPKGDVPRIALNSTYIQKNATDMVITTETSVAYVELWTKEHKSEMREVPVADVFAIVYFWRVRQSGLEKKALQLENIKGFADDVQYCVMKSYPRVIVSWHSVQGSDKRTKIRSYHLAADFQTVANISEIQPVEHHVTSLHNIEDCDNLVMGCGDSRVTLWNVEYGYIVATIEMSAITSPLSTLWVKSDRGFLFSIQQCTDKELRLLAVNGMNHSWKKLQNYVPTAGYDNLKGVCIENGILIGYYTQGILCWNAQSGELIVEEPANDCEYVPSGKHVIMIANETIIVKHSLSHLITDL